MIPGPNGEAVGTICTDPAEVDANVKHTYSSIYAGNIIGSPSAHAAAFISKYFPFIFNGPVFNVPPLTGTHLQEECTQGSYSAGGMDGWSPEDFSLLSLMAFEWLAELLNAIEGGMSWPSDLQHGRASFLAKGEEPSCDPLKYRILLLLPCLYRKWASTRLKHLAPWVESWACEEMYAGVPGQGAEDAWWLTSLLLEHADLVGKKLTAAGVDLYKCFDQINRTLAAMQLLAAGMPAGIVRAYMNFHDGLQVYNGLAGGLGSPYQKVMSIPQGCPFSMMIIALMLRPWIIMTRATNTIAPRVLADDLLLLGIGEGHIGAFHVAFNNTLEYMQDMGAKISPTKSYIFSNDASIRKWFSTFRWKALGVVIPVVLHLRDLGAHLNTSHANVGTTLTDRLRKCILKLTKLRFIPLDMDKKLQLITTNIFAGGLYGCEATYADESSLARLATAILDSLGHTSSNRSPELVFGMLKVEVEPVAAIFIRRMKMLRRMLCEHPQIQEGVQYILEFAHQSLLSRHS